VASPVRMRTDSYERLDRGPIVLAIACVGYLDSEVPFLQSTAIGFVYREVKITALDQPLH
jgi:hypothetical protein